MTSIPSAGSGGEPTACMPAVVRAYRELRGKGQPDRFAFEAALTIYLWHCPMVPTLQASQIVAGWVRERVTH